MSIPSVTISFMNQSGEVMATRVIDLASKAHVATNTLGAHFQKVTEGGRWRDEAVKMLTTQAVDDATSAAFHTYWTVAGHRIREQIDDDTHLVLLLRAYLPPPPADTHQSGAALVTLYRGENAIRFDAGRIGLCWSHQEATAAMFAEGLNAMHGGGVLITAKCPTSGIIAGASPHSLYLGEDERTVDPSQLIEVVEIGRYPDPYNAADYERQSD
jgi:hypothetical protein